MPKPTVFHLVPSVDGWMIDRRQDFDNKHVDIDYKIIITVKPE